MNDLDEIEYDRNGGVRLEGESEKARASRADLISMPERLRGVGCGNCKFFSAIGGKPTSGWCRHPAVDLPVSVRQCCNFWDHPHTFRAF